MNKKLSLLTLALATTLGAPGCVEEPPSLTITSVSAPSDCSPGGQKYITEGMYDPDLIKGYTLFLNVYNSMPNKSAWASSSSGSGSSGATFEPEIVENNTLTIDQVIFKCIEIDGDEDGCDGKDPIKKNIPSFSIRAGQPAIYPVTFAESDASEWGNPTNVLVDVQLAFHDTGVFSGKSSHVKFGITRIPGYFMSLVSAKCKPNTLKRTTDCAVMGQDDPLDEGAWSCDELEEDDYKDGGDNGTI